LYLWPVNKQVGYITSAHLILFAAALGTFFISKIPFNSSDSDYHLADNDAGSKKEIILSDKAIKGKTLFFSKCGSCHKLFGTAVGPQLATALEKEPWTDRTQLYKWIRNPAEFMKTNEYTRELKKTYGSIMQGSPNLTDEEIDAIVEYITMATLRQPAD
jgi:cytochrome c2